MLACAHDGRIDQLMLDLGFAGHGVNHAFPHTLATPPGETHVHRMPSTERIRQIAPRAAGPADPEDSFDKPTIVGRRVPWIAFLARQDGFDSCPYFIAQ
jgi:hypothetical protein